MVVLRSLDSTMYECRVLYIGSAPPIETLKGIDALQEPLRQRYPNNLDDVEGIDANIRVHPTELEVIYTASGQVINFPLSRLTICAGVRAVNVVDGTTGESSRHFVPVNTVQQDSKHPAIFAAIIRRNKGRQIAECHMFICNSTRDALHLVNATATANMALKQGKSYRNSDSSRYENDVVVVRSEVVDGYTSGATVNGGHVTQSYVHEAPAYVKTVNNLDPDHFQIKQPMTETAAEPETIYITFDKANLIPKGDDLMEVRHTPRQHKIESRPTYITVPSQRQYVEVPAPRAYVHANQYSIRPIAVPPPPPPPPQPVLVPRPLPLLPPPPAPQMFIRPQQRIYTRRVVAPPPQRFVSQPPVYYRTRARSVSPIQSRHFEMETRLPSRKGQYQPKWQGERRPASEFGYRMSRRELPSPPLMYQSGPPRDFRQSENMFINERAFSRRINGDNGISRSNGGYYYPTAYDLSGPVLYDRPTTKSNPRYSSSSDSDIEGRNSPVRRSRR